MYLNPDRMRVEADTLEKCIVDKLMPGVIKGREEHDDIDLIFPWNCPYKVTRVDHGQVRPWHAVHPETEEEIRCTVQSIDYHMKTKAPYFMELQRYIVGRPNLLRMSIAPVQEDKSLHFQAGADFRFLVDHVWVWCFNDSYPARFEVDCALLTPRNPFRVGDLEKMLPHGMYLHKKYSHAKFQAIARLKQTNVYINRKNTLED